MREERKVNVHFFRRRRIFPPSSGESETDVRLSRSITFVSLCLFVSIQNVGGGRPN